MPKQKSHSGAKKRVRKTGSGKLVIKRNSRNHLLLQKSKRQKSLSRTLLAGKGDAKKLKSLLPNL
jgi:large subunit ribosomal protein L35